MTRAVFVQENGKYTAFTVWGHSSRFAREGSDIVCAAVSSAVYLTANTVTDVFASPAAVLLRDGFFSLRLSEQNDTLSALLRSLALHLRALERQYPGKVKVRIITTQISEVRNHA